MSKEYLGDSVYVKVENGTLKLTTENGFGASNTIFLEPKVYVALVEYATNSTNIGTDAVGGFAFIPTEKK